jgi:hypothetical protein
MQQLGQPGGMLPPQAGGQPVQITLAPPEAPAPTKAPKPQKTSAPGAPAKECVCPEVRASQPQGMVL